MNGSVKRFLQWKQELNEKLWPVPLLSPLYDAGLVIKKITKPEDKNYKSLFSVN
jgi:hypothetical protein